MKYVYQGPKITAVVKAAQMQRAPSPSLLGSGKPPSHNDQTSLRVTTRSVSRLRATTRWPAPAAHIDRTCLHNDQIAIPARGDQTDIPARNDETHSSARNERMLP